VEDVAAGAGAGAAAEALDTAGVQAIVEGNHFFTLDFSCKLTLKFYCSTLNASYISLW